MQPKDLLMTAHQVWVLIKAATSSWVDDYAQSMGAALAYYTMFSIAPLLLIVISIAGLVFGVDAARGEISGQLQGLLGLPAAQAVQSLLESVNQPAESVSALLIGAVFGLALYFINFYLIAPAAFPWFTMAQNWVSILSHLIYGVVLGAAYAALRKHKPAIAQ